LFPSFSSFHRLRPVAALFILLFLSACGNQTIMVSSATGEAREAEENGVIVWARGNMQDHQRADAIISAIQRDPTLDISAQARMFHIGAGSYASLWEAANARERPPDIVYLEMAVLPDWAARGRLEPLDACLAQHAEFDAVRPSLWSSVTWRGQRWGVPNELGLHLLFFNKHKLSELGWSQAEIVSLPDRIQRGDFSLEDLAATARQAIAKGVAAPGFGYWSDASALNHYAAFGGRVTDPAQPDKLVISRNALEETYAFAHELRRDGITPARPPNAAWNRAMGKSVWNDTVSHGQALFWDAANWNWVRWQEYYTANADEAGYLEAMAGYALQPGGQRGDPGFAWGQTSLYALSANRSQADKERACRILARTTAPDIHLAHVTDNFYQSVLSPEFIPDAQAADYQAQDILRFGETVTPQVRMLPVHEDFGRYKNILERHLQRAEMGDLAPSAAADAAIRQLQTELGDALIVEP